MFLAAAVLLVQGSFAPSSASRPFISVLWAGLARRLAVMFCAIGGFVGLMVRQPLPETYGGPENVNLSSRLATVARQNLMQLGLLAAALVLALLAAGRLPKRP